MTALLSSRYFGFGHLGLPSPFVICHSSFSVDISRPNEFADQFGSGALRARVARDGPGDPDATAKE